MSTTRRLKHSNQHYQRALTRLPAGVTSNYRAWGPEDTLYVSRAKGPRLWDLDGNEYVDYRMGYGPAILGYADDRVDAAAMEGMKFGGTTALSTEREFSVADRIVKMVPGAELVRFTNSGTEAVMAALRLARAFTGRNEHIMVEGGYHGLSDGVLWEMRHDRLPNGEIQLDVVPEGKGVPPVLRDFVHLVPLNDAEALAKVLDARGGQIAALLIEPIMGNAGGIPASPEYLRAIRSLCDQHGVVLLIDEVKTGFRVARGGVQELMGVRADLCTYAKALGNGYPISAVAGREDIMRTIGPGGAAQGGTYAGHPVSLAAAEKTLEILDETDALERIHSYGTRVQGALSEILDRRGIAHVFAGHPSMGGLYFRETPPQNYRDWVESDYELYDELTVELIDLGILCEPDSREPWFISAAHDEACLSETAEKFEVALAKVLDARAG